MSFIYSELLTPVLLWLLFEALEAYVRFAVVASLVASVVSFLTIVKENIHISATVCAVLSNLFLTSWELMCMVMHDEGVDLVAVLYVACGLWLLSEISLVFNWHLVEQLLANLCCNQLDGGAKLNRVWSHPDFISPLTDNLNLLVLVLLGVR